MNSFFNFVTELNCGVCHNKNDISSMARAGFIDHRRAKVEAKNGDACIIGFTGDLNSLVNERFDNVLSESQEEVFNTHYGVHMDTVWEFNRYLVKNNYSHIIRFQLSREQERMRTGVRIGQLYEGKKMDTKTLTTRSGIDVLNRDGIRRVLIYWLRLLLHLTVRLILLLINKFYVYCQISFCL